MRRSAYIVQQRELVVRAPQRRHTEAASMSFVLYPSEAQLDLDARFRLKTSAYGLCVYVWLPYILAYTATRGNTMSVTAGPGE